MKRLIPSNRGLFLSLAHAAYQGTLLHGAGIGLKQNTSDVFGVDLSTYAGGVSVDVAEQLGKLGQYNNLRAELALARDERKIADTQARAVAKKGMLLLKSILGTTWSPAWAGAGFTSGSLATRSDPVQTLTEMRNYFLVHPEDENLLMNVSAVSLNTALTTLVEKRTLVQSKKADTKEAMVERDNAFRTLNRRVSGLHSELRFLIPPDDSRWYDFGFPRPIDGKIPEPVAGLALFLGAPGEVRVAWEASARAAKYRVSRLIPGDTAPVEAGLVQDLGMTITGLPAGALVKVQVSAVNAAGETQPVEAEIQVP